MRRRSRRGARGRPPGPGGYGLLLLQVPGTGTGTGTVPVPVPVPTTGTTYRMVQKLSLEGRGLSNGKEFNHAKVTYNF
jgi:hypothetical protein